jgi:hypothetical protein
VRLAELCFRSGRSIVSGRGRHCEFRRNRQVLGLRLTPAAGSLEVRVPAAVMEGWARRGCARCELLICTVALDSVTKNWTNLSIL